MLGYRANRLTSAIAWLVLGAVLGGLAILSQWNYVVFHSLVELFSIGVAIAIFLIAWNVRRQLDNDFLLFIAVAYAAAGLVDLIHTLAYPGMGAIPGVTMDPPTQLWIAARYLQSLCLLIAPIWLTRRLPLKTALVTLCAIAALVLLSIFRPWPWLPVFPTTHLGAAGLTPFKVVSEYIISGIFLAAVAVLWMRRSRLDKTIFRYMVVAIVVTMASELAFTSYVSVQTPSNMIGHLLKALAMYLTYKALIEAGLRRPFDVLFHGMADSERRFRTLTLATFEGIAISENGRFVDCNDQLARMLGYTPAEIIGQEVTSFVHPDDRERILSNIRHGAESHLEHRMMRKDGTIIVAEVHGQTLGDPSRPTRLTAIRDITQRKQVEEALAAAKLSAEQAKAAAESANKAKDHFLAALSHELRTPLAPVLAAAGSLMADATLSLDVREDVELIRRNVGLEVALIDDLLDVTRVAANKLVLDKRPVDAAQVLRDAARICSVDLDGRSQTLTIDTPGEPYPMAADAARLHQVFWNLIKNAIKFTPQGGRISVRASAHEGILRVAVSDTGVGIEPALLSRIFDRFEQGEANTTRQFGGLGLGLAIAKAVVEMHGGQISAQSLGKDRGATFEVRLPTAPELTGELPNAPEPANGGAQGVAATALPLRILLVEDHADTAKIMRRLLSADGHEVQVATDLATAMKLAGEHAFDLMLSDLGLPDGSGLDLMRALRGRGINMPGIALSGFGQEQDMQQSREAGFAAHLVKPVSLPKLEEAVARTVGHCTRVAAGAPQE